MAKDPAFLFYPGDWLGGTLGMTFEEKGAYMELLMLQFNRGHMTYDMMRQTVGQNLDTLLFKFKKDSEGLYYNERLDVEKNKRKKYVQSRSNNKKGNNQHSKAKESTNHIKGQTKGHMTNHMENENENENINTIDNEIEILIWPTFEDFWSEYDKKIDKDKSKSKWDKLNQTDKEMIMAYIPDYIQSQPDKNFRRHPVTFLNNRTWENEIVTRNGNDRNDFLERLKNA